MRGMWASRLRGREGAGEGESGTGHERESGGSRGVERERKGEMACEGGCEGAGKTGRARAASRRGGGTERESVREGESGRARGKGERESEREREGERRAYAASRACVWYQLAGSADTQRQRDRERECG